MLEKDLRIISFHSHLKPHYPDLRKIHVSPTLLSISVDWQVSLWPFQAILKPLEILIVVCLFYVTERTLEEE